MNNNYEKMLPEDLKDLISNLQNILEAKEKSKSVIGLLVQSLKECESCPHCGSTSVKKNGTYNDKQLYKCNDCGKKFNEITNTPFHHTQLTYKQIEDAFQCIIDQFPIRKMAAKIGVSTKTAFVLRFKIITCLKERIKKIKLSGEIETDEYYISVNLKGTKKENMPRISKKRTRHGTGKGGINRHEVCITSGVDENDNIFFTVAGTGSVTTNMIEKTVVPRIENSNKVITDCKSSYEKPSKDNDWNLKQVKSNSYVDNEGNNLANINQLHSNLTKFLSNFRGVSTKHLQEYLDWFVFQKILDYQFEYMKQSVVLEKETVTKATEILHSNVCDNYSIFNFVDLYKDYNYNC